MYQEKYWRELDQMKVQVIYLELYLQRTVSIDRYINMFLAVTSSGSIASWVIWKELSFVWAGIIATSQALNVIKAYLPYSKRLKSLQGITNDLEAIFLSMEDNWFDVSEGRLTDEEIHKLHMRFKEKRRQTIQKHLGPNPLPDCPKFWEQSKDLTREYFTNFYNIGSQ